MPLDFYSIILVIISLSVVISLICVIVLSIKFQKKAKKKYNDLTNLINENKDLTFSVKDSLTPEEIVSIDSSVDPNSLMKSLYETYLSFANKTSNFDDNLDDVLTGGLKDFYINKINNFKLNGYADKQDNISLIGYSISEFKKDKLKFRMNISCFSYKTINDKIVSGSNTYRVEQILLVTYNKIGDKWLISNCDKIYEKKMSN